MIGMGRCGPRAGHGADGSMDEAGCRDRAREDGARKRRLAEALRENLRRRKAQARARQDLPSAADPGSSPREEPS
jgi:hypothetical protein